MCSVPSVRCQSQGRRTDKVQDSNFMLFSGKRHGLLHLSRELMEKKDGPSLEHFVIATGGRCTVKLCQATRMVD